MTKENSELETKATSGYYPWLNSLLDFGKLSIKLINIMQLSITTLHYEHNHKIAKSTRNKFKGT